MRWHIDYLLEHGQVLEVKRHNRNLSECELNRKVEELPGSGIVVPRFGSSDCKCRAHLFRFQRNPSQGLD